MPDLYAVFGNPIAHSQSPFIHRCFAEQTAQQLDYQAKLLDVDQFAQQASEFFLAGGKGANVTLPFKLEAYALADKLSERAEQAGAVNTLIYQNGQLTGDNTDGQGLVNDLTRLLGEVSGKQVLLIGAGGAAQGVIAPLFAAGVKQITVTNRTEQKAQSLADRFAGLGGINAVPLHQAASADIVINASSSGVQGQLPGVNDQVFQGAQLAYDMFYAAKGTAFTQWAKAYQVPVTSDGLGMLVGQAAESFYLWRGVRPAVQPVLTALRNRLSV